MAKKKLLHGSGSSRRNTLLWYISNWRKIGKGKVIKSLRFSAGKKYTAEELDNMERNKRDWET
jgi:hypothetical protein